VVAGKPRGDPASIRLVSVDECEVHCHPRLAKLWQRRGHPVPVPAAGADARFVVWGALDDASGRVVWEIGDRKDGIAFVALLDWIPAASPDQSLLVVRDNAGYHKGRVARAWWTVQAGRVRPLWQPPDAPQLNLVERIWRYGKDRPACHRWWADLAALKDPTADVLDRLTVQFHHPGGIRLRQDFCRSA
jgi:hypothetical protein